MNGCSFFCGWIQNQYQCMYLADSLSWYLYLHLGLEILHPHRENEIFCSLVRKKKWNSRRRIFDHFSWISKNWIKCSWGLTSGSAILCIWWLSSACCYVFAIWSFPFVLHSLRSNTIPLCTLHMPTEKTDSIWMKWTGIFKNQVEKRI